MCGKCRVITSAVLHMKNQSQIQDLGFQICIFLVRSQNTKDILCCRQFFFGIMNIQALSSYIVVVGLISVNRQKRKYADQIQALAKYIRKRNIIRIIIIGVKGQHTSGKSIHNIPSRRFHYYITDKVSRKRTLIRKKLLKFLQLLFIRQHTK